MTEGGDEAAMVASVPSDDSSEPTWQSFNPIMIMRGLNRTKNTETLQQMMERRKRALR